jgi:hypothetical protein
VSPNEKSPEEQDGGDDHDAGGDTDRDQRRDQSTPVTLDARSLERAAKIGDRY